jgi:CDP-diacylglycerol---glycerol-3-phosphate 3-phosphatidyltransferase
MNVSTFFTVIRFFGSLTVLPFFLLYDWFSYPMMNRLVGLLVFVLLSLTDFLDGYYARKNNTISYFGASFDPIADKCLMITTLICLLSRQRISIIFVLIMIMREVLMLSLRQYSAERGMIIPVSSSGKAKTFFQSIALSATIILPDLFFWNMVKNTLLVIASYFSLISFYQYAKKSWKKLF